MGKNVKLRKKEGIKMIGVWDISITDTITGKTRTQKLYNLTPDVFLEALAEQTAGENTTDIGDNIYVALGDDNTAAAAGDTTLGNEVTRKAQSDGSVTSTTGKATVFFNSSEVSGTYEELGLFMDGKAATASAAADSGILASHQIQTLVISASETLTVTFSLTYARA